MIICRTGTREVEKRYVQEMDGRRGRANNGRLIHG